MSKCVTELDEKDLNSRQFLMEHVARVYAPLNTLLSDKPFMTEKEIKIFLEDDSALKSLEADKKDLETELEKYRTFIDKDWETELKQKNKEIEKTNIEKITLAMDRRVRRDKVRIDLDVLKTQTTITPIKELATKGIAELDVVESECRPIIGKYLTIAEYKSQILESLQNKIKSLNIKISAENEKAVYLGNYISLGNDIEHYLNIKEEKIEEPIKTYETKKSTSNR